MANHKSASKRIRQTKRKTLRNKVKVSETRSAIKNLRVLIAEGKKDEATAAHKRVQSLIGKLASKGITKKNTAARKTSRLAKQISSL